MESIYKGYHANASAKINIKEYFDRYTHLIRFGTCETTSKIHLGKKLLDELSESCSINQLSDDDYFIPQENRTISKYIPKEPQINTDIDLQTLTKLKEKYSEYSPKIFRPSLKYQSELTVTYSQPIDTGSKAISGEDTLIFIRIYHPFTCHAGEIPRKRQRLALNHVMVMLGRQTLADLRDKIQCMSDLLVTTESSDNPTEYISIANKDIYKSSFFYIENIFYNDTRHPSCHDNSEPICEWAKTRDLGPFDTAKMEETRIDSLIVRFGYPWVFQHQGNCEHLVVFSDARLINENDHLAIANYPRVHRAKPVKYPTCMMCSENSVHWIVFDCDRVPHDCCYFCNKCYIAYNYIDGKKIGTFKAYRYPLDPELVNWINDKKAEYAEKQL